MSEGKPPTGQSDSAIAKLRRSLEEQRIALADDPEGLRSAHSTAHFKTRDLEAEITELEARQAEIRSIGSSEEVKAQAEESIQALDSKLQNRREALECWQEHGDALEVIALHQGNSLRYDAPPPPPLRSYDIDSSGRLLGRSWSTPPDAEIQKDQLRPWNENQQQHLADKPSEDLEEILGVEAQTREVVGSLPKSRHRDEWLEALEQRTGFVRSVLESLKTASRTASFEDVGTEVAQAKQPSANSVGTKQPARRQGKKRGPKGGPRKRTTVRRAAIKVCKSQGLTGRAACKRLDQLNIPLPPGKNEQIYESWVDWYDHDPQGFYKQWSADLKRA